jgi:hypothetical protein
MANAVYDKAREGFATAKIDWDVAVIKAILVRAYTPNLATHEFVSDVTGGGGGTIVATSVAFENKTFPAGVLDADDIVFEDVAPTTACQHVIVYQSSAVTGGADVAASAQRLIVAFDTASGVGLPVTPVGSDIEIIWPAANPKILRL